MCVTVLSLPEREANSAASLSDSRSCFAGVEDAESGMALFAGHAAGVAVGDLAETLVAVGVCEEKRQVGVNCCSQFS